MFWIGVGVCRDCSSCQGESCGWFSCGESFWSEPGFESCAKSCSYAHNLYGRRHLPASKTPERLVRTLGLLLVSLSHVPFSLVFIFGGEMFGACRLAESSAPELFPSTPPEVDCTRADTTVLQILSERALANKGTRR